MSGAEAAKTDVDWTLVDIPVAADSQTLSQARFHPNISVRWKSENEDWVGIGIATIFRGTGKGRFEEIRNAIQHANPSLRIFGGFSFHEDSRTDDGPWREKSDAYFVLPRWLIDFGRGIIFFAMTETDETPSADEVGELFSHRAQPLPTSPRTTENAGAAWKNDVEALIANIRDGYAEKIVASRKEQFAFAASIPIGTVLDRLEKKYPHCTIFGIRLDSGFFLGATPETLVQMRSGKIATHALAGSSRRRDSALLASAKDVDEHALVINAIRERLAAIATHIRIDASPSLRTLANVTHLQTTILADADPNTDILDFVAALHPTPAVGGTPREVALKWIAEHENHRGYYASPVGMIENGQSGHFAVALRCALLQNEIATAWAGAGIVAGSDANAEFRETKWKFSAIRDALGLDDGCDPDEIESPKQRDRANAYL